MFGKTLLLQFKNVVADVYDQETKPILIGREREYPCCGGADLKFYAFYSAGYRAMT